MLLPRLLTALIGIPLLLLVIHIGSWPFLAFSVGVAFLSLYEYGLMLRIGGRRVQTWLTVTGGSLLCLAVGLGRPGGIGSLAGDPSGTVLTVFLLLFMLREIMGKDYSLERVALSLFGMLFIGWTLAHLALLREMRPYGEGLTYLLFAAIWTADTTAYIVGKNFGRIKLAPRMSPGKTWEGAVAGFIGSCVAVLAGRAWFLPDAFGVRTAFVLGALIGVVGPVSDIAESVLKRAAGVKDSSSLLPGHGGVLDRFDSFLLTTPLLYYALILRR